MPAGVSTGKYISFLAASLVSMLIGAEMVHTYYKPLQDMDELVKAEKEKILAELAVERKKSESAPGK